MIHEYAVLDQFITTLKSELKRAPNRLFD